MLRFYKCKLCDSVPFELVKDGELPAHHTLNQLNTRIRLATVIQFSHRHPAPINSDGKQVSWP